jgi:hypothetical protein
VLSCLLQTVTACCLLRQNRRAFRSAIDTRIYHNKHRHVCIKFVVSQITVQAKAASCCNKSHYNACAWLLLWRCSSRSCRVCCLSKRSSRSKTCEDMRPSAVQSPVSCAVERSVGWLHGFCSSRLHQAAAVSQYSPVLVSQAMQTMSASLQVHAMHGQLQLRSSRRTCMAMPASRRNHTHQPALRRVAARAQEDAGAPIHMLQTYTARCAISASHSLTALCAVPVIGDQ